MKHSYRGMALTGAPGARCPTYLRADQFDRYPDLDGNGHAPETLDIDASDHTECDTGWIDVHQVYVTDSDGKVQGFRKADGSIASEEDLEADARRYSANFSADSRFCHIFNHSHSCKPTCFKVTEYKKPSETEAPKQRQAQS